MKDKWPSEFPGTNWIDSDEEHAAVDVVRKGALFRYYGPEEPTHVSALEERAKSIYGCRYALAINGGTGALITSLVALSIGPGDEVIIPSFLWVSTVGAVVYANAVPVLCEVDSSFTMDPEDLEKKITANTKLIIAVHMAGTPCDMGRVMEIADRRDIPVIEDCAQCNGGSFLGRKLGTFGKIGIFSFQINKNITSGEGGLLVTDDELLYQRLNAAHDVGVPWKNAEPAISSGVTTWGQGRRMAELCGAVANIQLGKLARVVEHTRGSHGRLRSALSSVTGLELRTLNDHDGHTGSFLVLILPDGSAAKTVAENLGTAGLGAFFILAEYGLHIYFNIPQLVEHVPLSLAGNPWSLPQNVGLVRNYAKGECPASDDLFERSIIITVPSRLSAEQEEKMAGIIRNAVTQAMPA